MQRSSAGLLPSLFILSLLLSLPPKVERISNWQHKSLDVRQDNHSDFLANFASLITERAEGLIRNRRQISSVDQAENCYPDLYGQCCLRKVLINFADFGWDQWIASPKSYYHYYCTGNCRNQTPFPFTEREKSAKRTFCVPKRSEGLVIMYKRGRTVLTTKRLENMIVKECGCKSLFL